MLLSGFGNVKSSLLLSGIATFRDGTAFPAGDLYFLPANIFGSVLTFFINFNSDSVARQDFPLIASNHRLMLKKSINGHAR